MLPVSSRTLMEQNRNLEMDQLNDRFESNDSLTACVYYLAICFLRKKKLHFYLAKGFFSDTESSTTPLEI